MRTRLVALLSSPLLAASAFVGLGVAAPPPAAAAGVQVIPVPTSSAGVGRIVTAPDGTIWFAEQDANKVGRISTAGQLTEIAFPAESPGISQLLDLAVAPDSSVWVIYESGERVRHIAANGTTIVDGSIGGYPYGEQVRVDPSGTAWITMSFDEQYVIRIVGNTIYRDPNAPECEDALGEAADGSMWCRTDSGLTHLNSTASGGTTYPANNYAASPYAIAAGPVGSIWFGRYFAGSFYTPPDSGEVGYLDASTGAVTAFNTGERTAPSDLVQGPDGSMWFTSIGDAKGIGHVSASGAGALTQIGGYAPGHLTFGNDGSIWATDATNNVIIHVGTDQLQTTNVDPGAGSLFQVGATATAAGAGGAATLAGKIKAGKKPVTVHDGRVGVKVSCPKAATSPYKGKATLVTKGKGHQAVSAKARYKIKPGKHKTIHIKLSKKGLAKVPRHHVTKLTVRLLVKGTKKPADTSTIRVRR